MWQSWWESALSATASPCCITNCVNNIVRTGWRGHCNTSLCVTASRAPPCDPSHLHQPCRLCRPPSGSSMSTQRMSGLGMASSKPGSPLSLGPSWRWTQQKRWLVNHRIFYIQLYLHIWSFVDVRHVWSLLNLLFFNNRWSKNCQEQPLAPQPGSPMWGMSTGRSSCPCSPHMRVRGCCPWPQAWWTGTRRLEWHPPHSSMWTETAALLWARPGQLPCSAAGMIWWFVWMCGTSCGASLQVCTLTVTHSTACSWQSSLPAFSCGMREMWPFWGRQKGGSWSNGRASRALQMSCLPASSAPNSWPSTVAAAREAWRRQNCWLERCWRPSRKPGKPWASP